MIFQSNRKPMLVMISCSKKSIVLLLLVFSILSFFYIHKNRASELVDQSFDSQIVYHANCSESLSDHRQFVYLPHKNLNSDDLSQTIFFVTPTYPRGEQIPEITRLGQTLMHVRNLFWIVADDTNSCNSILGQLLDSFGIPYVHLLSPMPSEFREKSPRGVSNRLAAMNWIKSNKLKKGVMYFGDDDNTYDLRLFNEIRSTRSVSIFPVGFITSLPIVKDGKIVAFFDSWAGKQRQWPVDMAGFAVNLSYLRKFPNATMNFKAGDEESSFLKSIGLTFENIEPKANNCTEIYVWHTQTKKNNKRSLKVREEELIKTNSNLLTLLNNLGSMGVSWYNESGSINAIVYRAGEARPLNELSIWT